MRICQLCYREFKDEDMSRKASGEIADHCNTCNGILGKGPGYAGHISDGEANKWFEGVQERKAKLNNK